jgi:hypothetical protein
MTALAYDGGLGSLNRMPSSIRNSRAWNSHTRNSHNRNSAQKSKLMFDKEIIQAS